MKLWCSFLNFRWVVNTETLLPCVFYGLASLSDTITWIFLCNVELALFTHTLVTSQSFAQSVTDAVNCFDVAPRLMSKLQIDLIHIVIDVPIVASSTKKVNPRLDKRPLMFNGRLANRGLTSFVKAATWPATAKDSLTNSYWDETYFGGYDIFHYQMGRNEIRIWLIYVMRLSYQPMIRYNRHVIQRSQEVDAVYENPVNQFIQQIGEFK